MTSTIAWRAAAGLGVGVPAAASAWHVLRRAAPPTWDEAAYLSASCWLWDHLASGRLWAFCRQFAHASEFKAPLVSLLPLPAYLLAGKGLAPALCANVAAWALAGWCAWRLGRRFAGEAGGAWAAGCVALLPLGYGLSRHFYAEPLLTAIVLGTLEVLLAGGRPVALGLLLGLGMLAKVSFPLYVAVPMALLWRRERGAREWALAAAIGGLAACTWYALHGASALSFARSAGFGRTAAEYSSGEGLGAAARYAWLLARQCASLPMMFLAAASLTELARTGRLARWRAWDPGAWAVAGAAALPLIVAASSVNREPRFALPALAAAAVGTGVLCAKAWTATGRRGTAVAALAAAAALGIFFEQTTGRRLLGTGRAEAFVWNGPPLLEGAWGQERVLALVAREAATLQRRITVAIGIESPSFNPATAEYFAAVHDWPLTVASYRRPRDAAGALAAVEASRAEFVVAAEDWPPGDLPAFLNGPMGETRETLASGALGFRPWLRAKLLNGATAVVFRRSPP